MAEIVDIDAKRVAPYLLRAVLAFLDDPPDSDYQAGFLAALLTIYREGLGKGIDDARLKMAGALIRPNKPPAAGEGWGPAITLPVEDYERLVEAATCDDMIVICIQCGAWLDRDDEAYAGVEDFAGCWKAATDRTQDEHLCRSYRAVPAGLPASAEPPSGPRPDPSPGMRRLEDDRDTETSNG